MCLLVLLNLNLVLCKETEKIGIPPQYIYIYIYIYQENHLYVIFYTQKKGKKAFVKSVIIAIL